MSPFEQGGLDALCGIYSIVNADRIINNTTEEGSKALFKEIAGYFEQRGMLASILTEGMFFKQIKAVLSDVIGDRIPYRTIRYSGVSTPDLRTFWGEIKTFLRENEKRAVLLGLSGVHDHWTIVKSISDRQIQLLDSGSLRHLNRITCTTGNVKGKRQHMLFPAQTYFLGSI